MLCYSGWRTHKGICSWTGPLSGDGILFLKLSVPLKRRWWKDRSEPGWVCRCHTCGAGSLAPRPASPLGWKLADPRAPIWQRCLLQGCVHSWWKVPSTLKVAFSLDCFFPRSTCKLLLWMDTVTSAYNNRVFLSSSAIPTWPGMTHSQYL